MSLSRHVRLAAPALAAALLLAPALRLACDTVCAQPPAPAATHCSGGDSSDPAHGNPAGDHGRPDGCRHSDDVVLAKTTALIGVPSAVSLVLADLAPSASIVLAPVSAPSHDTHRRSPPPAAGHAPSVLRL